MRTAEKEESHANEKWARYVHVSGCHPLQGHEKRAPPTLVLRTFCVLRPQVTRNVRHVEGSQVYRRPRRIEAHRVGLNSHAIAVRGNVGATLREPGPQTHRPRERAGDACYSVMRGAAVSGPAHVCVSDPCV
jgi:hypothetical protein